MATKKPDQVPFEASAHLQVLLGRELFRSEEFAIVELVKNAYDARARHVVVSISLPSVKRVAEITISDDGTGMSRSDFERLFMTAGYSERDQQVRNARIPTGEKGVGRFAADRLGTSLQVLSRTRDDSRTLVATIDWLKFADRKKKFHDITADVSFIEDRPEALSSPGTVLRIGNLRNNWAAKDAESVRSALEELLDPFAPPDNFSISLEVEGHPKLSGPIVPKSLAEPDIELRFSVAENGATRRKWFGPGGAEAAAANEEKESHPDLSGLRGRFFYFLKKPKVDQAGGRAPGVRIFRDGFRLEPFGDKSADWLGIQQHRAKRAGHAHVVPSRVFGFISIQRQAHRDLRSTTSREALVDSPAARSLVSMLRGELKELGDRIHARHAAPRWTASRQQRAQDLERARGEAVSNLSYGLAHELRQPLQVIESETGNIGLILQEMKIENSEIGESQAAISAHIRRIDDNIKFLSSISSGTLVSADKMDLADFIRQECSLMRRRAEAKGIELAVSVPAEQRAVLNKPTVAAVLANLLINAIQALEGLKGNRQRRITVGLSRERGQHLITVADTGEGISPEMQAKLFKRFATGKTGGMGFGLYHCKTLVEARKGTISVTSKEGVGAQFSVRLPDDK